MPRRVFFALSIVALLYALIAGLRTLSDLDLGWQLATGRWVMQHHRVPAVDVFSYTAAGKPWIYPVGSGVIFYLAYLGGGYALLSWIGAAACVSAVAFMLRRNSAIGAALAIVAVPLIAMRTTPRADMFTVVLFPAFFSVLWEQHRTGRARLWLLPVIMAAWANLHPGFIAGFGLAAAYVAMEVIDAVVTPKERIAAIGRLRRSAGWLALAAFATLMNPFGWNIYRELVLQQRAGALLENFIAEWVGVPMKWAAIANSFSIRQTQATIYILLAVALVAAALAAWRAEFGPALLLLGSMYVAVRFARMGPLFAGVVVIAGGTILADALQPFAKKIRASAVVGYACAAALATLAAIRCYDLATDRFYFGRESESNFGTGLGWWFPQRAAGFIRDHNLPGEVFNSFNEGGFVIWKLAPDRRDMIDGRILPFGGAQIRSNNSLLKSSPDSAAWREEIARYDINTILLPLGRFDGIEAVQLPEFCNSRSWQPVYLDEISIVLVRRTAETEDLRRRFALDCATAPLPAAHPGGPRAADFNAFANAAGVLFALGRNQEALAATDHALGIFPDSAFLHWMRGNILLALGHWNDSEDEYLEAIQLEPSDVVWAALADGYGKHGRMPEAVDAIQHAIGLSVKPHSLLLNLGYFYLNLRQPANALSTLDQAAREAPGNLREADNGTFDFMLAQGRSVAWSELGDPNRAVEFQQQAVRIKSDAREPWRRLAELYRRAGRIEDAARAEQRAAALETPRVITSAQQSRPE